VGKISSGHSSKQNPPFSGVVTLCLSQFGLLRGMPKHSKGKRHNTFALWRLRGVHQSRMDGRVTNKFARVTSQRGSRAYSRSRTPTGPHELSLQATPTRNCLKTSKKCWRRERDSNPAAASVRSVTYYNHWSSDPHTSPRNPGFATRFATRERASIAE